MKKCPYCAEKIKAEASVCRYCGRDVTLKPPRPALVPAWKQGLKAALIFLGVALIGLAVNIGDPPEGVVQYAVNIPVGFLLWWGIVTVAVVAWRTIAKRA